MDNVVEQPNMDGNESVDEGWEENARLQQEQEERQQLDNYIQEITEKLEFRQALKAANIAASNSRPDESYFTKLDSNIKKNTAFVRKLKSLSDISEEKLLKEFKQINLTKYVQECAQALMENKLKLSDIPYALRVCTNFNQRYGDFSGLLLDAFVRLFPAKKEDKIENLSKFRVDLRLFADLIAIGVLPEQKSLQLLGKQLMLMVDNDLENHNNVSVLVRFLKDSGDDFAGVLPRKLRLLSEKYQRSIPRSMVLPPDKQLACRALFKKYFDSLSKRLVEDCKKLRQWEKHDRRILLTKGELNEDRNEKSEKMKADFDKLLQNVINLADLVDEDAPELPPLMPTDYDDGSSDALDPLSALQNKDLAASMEAEVWEDDDTRQFYQNLLDIRSLVPAILYKDCEKPKSVADENSSEQAEPGKSAVESVTEDMAELDIEAVELELMTPDTGADNAPEKEDESADELEHDDDEKLDAEEDEQISVTVSSASHSTVPLDLSGEDSKLLLKNYFKKLPTCVNRDLIDRAALEFVQNFNTKINRHRLVRALFNVYRTRYDLLPFYSRLVATLHLCMPDISEKLCDMLLRNFRYHVRKKDQIIIETKLRTTRFIGELVKFGLFSTKEALNCLMLVLREFQHHNIDMCCALLETCGRFLYRTAQTHARTKLLLDIMMRKKNSSLHLDQHYTSMIENAYYTANPPLTPHSASVKDETPPVQQYIRKLIYVDLNKTTVEKVVRQLRKLDWQDPTIKAYLVKCLFSAFNVKYSNISCLATVLSDISRFHNDAVVHVLDAVLEDIRLGMEVNLPKFYQRRLAMIHYLGELYAFYVIDSDLIFKVFYSLITFGVSPACPPPMTSIDTAALSNVDAPLDPPDHLFRIRLCAELLHVCGKYFSKGAQAKKLDCFLLYLQRYVWFKRQHAIWECEGTGFPQDIEHIWHEAVEKCRPKFKYAKTAQDATERVTEMETQLRKKYPVLEQVAQQQQAPSQGGGGSADELQAIAESDEFMPDDDELLAVAADDDAELHPNADDPRLRSALSNDDIDDYPDDAVPQLPDDAPAIDTDLPPIDQPNKLTDADQEFMTQFDKLMVDMLTHRSSDSTSKIGAANVSTLNIAVPKNVKEKLMCQGGSRSVRFDGDSQQEVVEEQAVVAEATSAESTVKFIFLTKKGTKPQFSRLEIPADAKFAARYLEREMAERREKEQLKQVVLEQFGRQEGEEMAKYGGGDVEENLNRERRPKYQQPPKGAPDADLIFGAKKR